MTYKPFLDSMLFIGNNVTLPATSPCCWSQVTAILTEYKQPAGGIVSGEGCVFVVCGFRANYQTCLFAAPEMLYYPGLLEQGRNKGNYAVGH